MKDNHLPNSFSNKLSLACPHIIVTTYHILRLYSNEVWVILLLIFVAFNDQTNYLVDSRQKPQILGREKDYMWTEPLARLQIERGIFTKEEIARKPNGKLTNCELHWRT